MLQTLRLCLIRSSRKRAQYLSGVFAHVGENCSIMDRKIPLYPELIYIGNNVHIASHVFLTVHDIAHVMINYYEKKNGGDIRLNENIGCIKIEDNVFIGSGTRILGNVHIGSNCIIGGGTLITKDIPGGSVVAGVPAKVIGTFDDFIQKRSQTMSYPAQYAPKKEAVSPELAKWCWQEFERERNKK